VERGHVYGNVEKKSQKGSSTVPRGKTEGIGRGPNTLSLAVPGRRRHAKGEVETEKVTRYSYPKNKRTFTAD